MKKFSCGKCGNTVYFENVTCLRCRSPLGFHVEGVTILALEPVDKQKTAFRRVGAAQNRRLRYCANASYGVCNWLTTSSDPSALCRACSLNRTIPNLSESGNLEAWRLLERAKKRLVYSLLRFGLPFDTTESPHKPLTLDFARDTATGHLDGVITIDIMEADAVERERQRQHFQEPYRSLLGHLRHESGHYYWPLATAEPKTMDEFRSLFGDERQDYSAALAAHHADGPPADWSARHVSAYASAHPWEDWAETWAHYLHLVDALDTAEASGLEPRAAGIDWGAIWPFKRIDVYREGGFPALMERWIPLTLAMNGLNRSMGHSDFYPFVIPAPAYDKLAFVHRVIRDLRH
jgi:hypothetical protein